MSGSGESWFLRSLGTLAGLAACALLVACKGKQTLYVVNDTESPVDITIDGKMGEWPTADFASYSHVKLTKGVTVVASRAGVEVDRIELPVIAENETVIYVVAGTGRVHLTDYQRFANFGHADARFTKVSADEIDFVGGDTTPHYVTLDARSVVVGPSAPLPAGGKATAALEKLPIVRAERVPEGNRNARVWIAERATRELTHAMPGLK